MATSPKPLPYERRLRELDGLLRSAVGDLTERLRFAIRSGDRLSRVQARAQLAAALRVLDQLGHAVDPLARQLVAEAHAESATRTLTEIRVVADLPEVPGAFNSVAREAVEQMQGSLLDDLASRRQQVGRRVADVFAREQRHAAVRALLGADGSPRVAAARLEATLRQTTTAFVDRAGKRWQLDTYSRMAVRTVTREAVTHGAVARMAANGVNLAKVSTSPGACDDCKPREGRLISLDGATAEWEGQPVFGADDLPPFHPNCTHSLQPFVAAIELLKRELDAAAAGTLDRLAAAGVAGA